MSALPETGRRTGVAARLGVPALRGRGRFITGNLVDSVGNGMLLPLGLLYFTDVRGLPVAQVGTPAVSRKNLLWSTHCADAVLSFSGASQNT